MPDAVDAVSVSDRTSEWFCRIQFAGSASGWIGTLVARNVNSLLLCYVDNIPFLFDVGWIKWAPSIRPAMMDLLTIKLEPDRAYDGFARIVQTHHTNRLRVRN